jgi:hypothetical protein
MKGEISITVVIGAVIALLVLVVLVFIFVGQGREFGVGVSNCVDKGGSCDVGPTCASGKFKVWGATCRTDGKVDSTQICCSNLDKK